MVGLRAGSPVDAPTSAQQQLCLLPLLCVPSTPPSKIPIQGKGAHGTALNWIEISLYDCAGCCHAWLHFSLSLLTK
jgi:hypothetical protein